MYALQILFTRYPEKLLIWYSRMHSCWTDIWWCFVTCLYRSPRQNDDELKTFCSNLTFLFNVINRFQPYSVLLRDIHAQHSKWCPTGKTNRAGFYLENITSTDGYNQMINKPKHFLMFQYLELIWFLLQTGVIQLLEFSNQFLINIIMILYTESSILTYLYHHLIIGKYGIMKKRTL